MAAKSLDLTKSLECPVCMDLFENPRDLSCSHTFCQACVEQIANGSSAVVCPECRATTYLNRSVKGMGLKPNRVVGRLIETLKATDGEPSAEGEETCPSHSPHLRKYYCKKCEVLACSECVMELHLAHASTDTCSAQVFVDERKADMMRMLQESEDILQSLRENVKTYQNEKERGRGLLSIGPSRYELCIPDLINKLIKCTQTHDEKLNMEMHSRGRLITTRMNLNQLGKDLVEKGNAEGIVTTFPQWSEALESLGTMESTETGFVERDERRIQALVHALLVPLENLTTLLKEYQEPVPQPVDILSQPEQDNSPPSSLASSAASCTEVESEEATSQQDDEEAAKRSRVRVSGIPEEHGENTDDLVVQLINEKLGVPITVDDIAWSNRIGQAPMFAFTPSGRPKGRPIIAKFRTLQKKREVMAQTIKLKDSGFSLYDDLSREEFALLSEVFKHPKVTTAWTVDNAVMATVMETDGTTRHLSIPDREALVRL